jgi:hypothetical protein
VLVGEQNKFFCTRAQGVFRGDRTGDAPSI